MASLDTTFNRRLLSLMHRDVRKAFPKVAHLMRACTVTHSIRNHWFAEIDGDSIPSFSVEICASDAYDARYRAWSKFLAKHGPAEFHEAVGERRARRERAA